MYPLRFKEILRGYEFGDRWIERAFGAHKRGLPADHTLAETWEICARPGESSLVANGPWRGKTLGELIARRGDQLLGTAVVQRFGLHFYPHEGVARQ